MIMFIFIAGMTRSGKSSYAELTASQLGQNIPKIYIATSDPHNDPEILARIELHQARRKHMGFTTIERYRDLGGLVLPTNSCVLLESLTVWTANEMFPASSVNHNASSKIYTDFISIHTRVKNIVLVSDDVFSDGVEYDPLTEEYMRTLGGLHVKLAALADEVIEVVSGIPLRYPII